MTIKVRSRSTAELQPRRAGRIRTGDLNFLKVSNPYPHHPPHTRAGKIAEGSLSDQ